MPGPVFPWLGVAVRGNVDAEYGLAGRSGHDELIVTLERVFAALQLGWVMRMILRTSRRNTREGVPRDWKGNALGNT